MMNPARQLMLLISSAAVFSAGAAAQEHSKPVMDDRIYGMFLVDQLEHGFDHPSNTLRFNGQAWIGGDYNRIWINTEGTKRYSGALEDTDLQVLYGRLIAPFWDLQGGMRYFRPRPNAPSRGAAVFGIQGLAPYWFEVQAATFVSHKGEVSGRVEVEYDLRLTQRLIAQPRVETNIAVQSVRELGIGRGFSDGEIGLRLRYEIKREFAPYVGVVWTSKFGQTADFARALNEPVRNLGLVLGVRMWR
ncbi:MAG TPA: copper resistance protein B [Bryobacteraceae bacterium]|nr:copper resistance protein B [Bryobacteraceae bacterium]